MMLQCQKCRNEIGFSNDPMALIGDSFSCNACVLNTRKKAWGRPQASSHKAYMARRQLYGQEIDIKSFIWEFINLLKRKLPNSIPNNGEVVNEIAAFCCDIFSCFAKGEIKNVLVIGNGGTFLLNYLLSSIGCNVTFLDFNSDMSYYLHYSRIMELKNFNYILAQFGSISSFNAFPNLKNSFDLITMYDLAGGNHPIGIDGWYDDIVYFLKQEGGYVLFPKGNAPSSKNPIFVLRKLKEIRQKLERNYRGKGVFTANIDDKVRFLGNYNDDCHYLYVFKPDIESFTYKHRPILASIA